METLVDFRGKPAYQYRQRNHHIATMSKFSKIEITFDLNLKTRTGDYKQIPVLTFEGSRNSRLLFALNGWDEFWIMHHNSAMDGLGEYKPLIYCNLFFVLRIPTTSYRHYHILIVDGAKVALNVDGFSIYRRIERDICSKNETMNVWIGRPGFFGSGSTVNGTIKNLHIKVI